MGEIFVVKAGGKGIVNPKPALEQIGVVVHHKQGLYMIRLVNLIFFLGCALVVAHYYALGSMVQLLGAVGVALVLMRVLSSKRIH